jgi:hypothetical protein
MHKYDVLGRELASHSVTVPQQRQPQGTTNIKFNFNFYCTNSRVSWPLLSSASTRSSALRYEVEAAGGERAGPGVAKGGAGWSRILVAMKEEDLRC